MAFHHDFSNIIASGEMDKRAVEAMGEALAGSGRPLIVTSVIGHLPEGRLVTEEDVPDPDSAVKHRAASERKREGLDGLRPPRPSRLFSP